jgi:hypothetical protein
MRDVRYSIGSAPRDAASPIIVWKGSLETKVPSRTLQSHVPVTAARWASSCRVAASLMVVLNVCAAVASLPISSRRSSPGMRSLDSPAASRSSVRVTALSGGAICRAIQVAATIPRMIVARDTALLIDWNRRDSASMLVASASLASVICRR